MYGMGVGISVEIGVWAGCKDRCMGSHIPNWCMGNGYRDRCRYPTVWDGSLVARCHGLVYGLGVGISVGMGVWAMCQGSVPMGWVIGTQSLYPSQCMGCL